MELNKDDTIAIKGVAMLFMLWHHLFLFKNEYGVFVETLAEIFKVCVALFLFVSGYGLTKQFSKLEKPYFKNTVKFLIRRYVNFFLSYWFCFVLVVVVGNLSGLSFQDAYPASRNTLKCIILDVFGYMGSYSYLRTWWFNKMILQLYFVFPILYLLVKNRYCAVAGIVLIIILQLKAHSIPGKIFFVVEGGTPSFFLGMVMAKHDFLRFDKTKIPRLIGILISLVLCVGLSLFHAYLGIYGYEAMIIRALLALSIVCFLVFLFSFFPNCGRVLGFIGKYATIMYLTHSLLQSLMNNLIYSLHYPILVFLLFAVISFGVAVLIDGLQRLVKYEKLKISLVKLIEKW